MTGEVTDPDEVLIDYGDDMWEQVVVAPARERETGLTRSKLTDVLRGRSSPRLATRQLVQLAIVNARRSF